MCIYIYIHIAGYFGVREMIKGNSQRVHVAQSICTYIYIYTRGTNVIMWKTLGP